MKYAELLQRLTDYPPGPIPDDLSNEVVGKLVETWDSLLGSRDGGMHRNKLGGRMEAIRWDPPAILFKIERHGGFVKGSTRADVQSWRVDLEAGTAEMTGESRRQLTPMAKRVDVKPLAAEIADIIDRGAEDPRVKWSGPDRVRILVSSIIPATNAQTTAARRKRFAGDLKLRILPIGWRRVEAGSHLIFERPGGNPFAGKPL